MNFVTLSKSPVSVTENEHCACCAMLSRAVQATAVVPTAKIAPDAGAHVVVTGAAPPVVTGDAYVTVCPADPTPRTVTLAGHAIAGAAGVGPGVVGPPQRTATHAIASAAPRITPLVARRPRSRIRR
jgi:hypothetical protein